MDSADSAHPPYAPGIDIRCLSRPSLPTVTLSRVISDERRCFCAMV